MPGRMNIPVILAGSFLAGVMATCCIAGIIMDLKGIAAGLLSACAGFGTFCFLTALAAAIDLDSSLKSLEKQAKDKDAAGNAVTLTPLKNPGDTRIFNKMR